MKTIVTTPKNSDKIVIMSKSGNSAAIMLTSETNTVNDQGFLQVEKRVGLFKGKVEDINKIASTLKAGDNFSEKVLPVKLIVKESTTPFYEGQEPKINPETGAVIQHNEQNVYRQTFVVAETSTEVDAKLISDPVEATPIAPSAKKVVEEKLS